MRDWIKKLFKDKVKAHDTMKNEGNWASHQSVAARELAEKMYGSPMAKFRDMPEESAIDLADTLGISPDEKLVEEPLEPRVGDEIDYLKERPKKPEKKRIYELLKEILAGKTHKETEHGR